MLFSIDFDGTTPEIKEHATMDKTQKPAFLCAAFRKRNKAQFCLQWKNIRESNDIRYYQLWDDVK